MLMQMLGSFAEFEREMIRERTRAGLREARAKGRVPGRKPKITTEQQKEIVDAVSSGRKTSAAFETLHLALAPSRRLMRILSPIVVAQALLMQVLDAEIAGRCVV